VAGGAGGVRGGRFRQLKRRVRNFLVTSLRFFSAFLGAAIVAVGLAMLSSQLVTVSYRTYYHVPAGVNLIEDLRYVSYHTLIVLPIFIAVFIIAARWLWRWSRRFVA
jgi:dolichyl-phosphate-mannose--protein O-mannosyl transferase